MTINALITGRVAGLAGTPNFESQELTKLIQLGEGRAYAAYRQYDFWPQWLVVGEERAAVDGLIPFTETDLDNIDTFLRIYDAAPYAASSAGKEYEFHVVAGGAQVLSGSADATAYFVTYKKEFSGSWDASTVVPVGWENYLAYAIFSDFLRMDGQLEKAQAAELDAERFLIQELGRSQNQRNNSLIARRISTHVSRQRRF